MMNANSEKLDDIFDTVKADVNQNGMTTEQNPRVIQYAELALDPIKSIGFLFKEIKCFYKDSMSY